MAANGKGDKRRPRQVAIQTFNNTFDTIFKPKRMPGVDADHEHRWERNDMTCTYSCECGLHKNQLEMFDG